MGEFLYREAQEADVPAMAEIRSGDWGTEEFWKPRILAYMTGQSHPKEALEARVLFVCAKRDGSIVGLIAGHLTRRFGCDGELEWISVRPEYRGMGIASELFRRLAAWFGTRKASRICVDVEPTNELARGFYRANGAEDLMRNWMVWRDIRQLGSRSEE